MRRIRSIAVMLAVAALAVLLSGVGPCPSVPADVQPRQVTRVPALASLIDGVTRARLERIVKELSGATSATIGGATSTVRTRYHRARAQSDLAEQYVYEHLQAYGLSSVRYQTFVKNGVTYRNVIGEIRGSVHPEQVVLVGPHLDSRAETEQQSMTRAPGADDNASGVAAALVTAKVLAGERFERTIRFVFFDGEETHNHEGSMYYAASARAAGDEIVAMVSPDMIAYNGGSRVVGLHTRKPGVEGEVQGRALGRLYAGVVSAYGIAGVKPTVVADGSTASDHASFWFNGYPAAIMLVQDLGQIDPAYHSADDRISNFRWPYYVGASKGLLGMVATRAGFVATPLRTYLSGARNGAWYRGPVDVTLTAVGPRDGPAVASISYSIDGDVAVDVPGAMTGLSFPEADAADGLHRIVFHATDADGNSESNRTFKAGLDTVRPGTRALTAVRARRHSTATFPFRVDDPAPNGGTAKVVIQISDSEGRVVQRSPARLRRVNVAQAISMRMTLPKGRYHFSIEARDTAGNRQTSTGRSSLVVR